MEGTIWLNGPGPREKGVEELGPNFIVCIVRRGHFRLPSSQDRPRVSVALAAPDDSIMYTQVQLDQKKVFFILTKSMENGSIVIMECHLWNSLRYLRAMLAIDCTGRQ